MASVEITGAMEMRLGLLDVSSPANLHAFVVKPIFTHFGRVFTQSITDEFSGGSRFGDFKYLGEMAKQAENNFSVLRDNTLEIGENSGHGHYVRHGTDPWYTGTFGEMMQALRAGERIGFPRGVFDWAKSEKVNADDIGAYRIAWKIMTHGMGRVPNSPIRKAYPHNKRGYDYPNFLVNIKNKKDITRGIGEMRGLFVDLAFRHFG